jgi:N-acetylglucosaminyl-diphospho-decaprenol L-rhamnosyltransferase
MTSAMNTAAPTESIDLAVVTLSMNEAHWLRKLLPTLVPSLAGLRAEIVVADVESSDGTAAVVAGCELARLVPVINRGFAHANNVALMTVDARYVLFLNSDTEIQTGTFAELVAYLDAHPEIGMLGVRQLDSDGELFATMRRFASVRRRLAEAFGSERLAPSRGMRMLDMASYEVETPCDWTIGSFMLVRAEALASTGYMDERYFFTAEEQDLCLRMRQAGWEIVHVPFMTIVHHVGKRGANPRIEAQQAYCELQYAKKHFGLARQLTYRGALALNYGMRSIPPARSRADRKGSRWALRTILGLADAPFVQPPRTALPAGTRDAARRSEPV